MDKPSDKESELSDLEQAEVDVIQVFVGLAKLAGLPKSVGEIYGLLYMSKDPLSMDQIIKKLNISQGSASQGLKQLKSFKAVSSPYLPGERKEYYVAELELRKLVAGFVKEEVFPYLDNATQRLDELKEHLKENGGAKKEFLDQRISALRRWHSYAATFLKNAIRLVNI
jgi:DNA-binding transcriptional regulator GbsR (MarR family)